MTPCTKPVRRKIGIRMALARSDAIVVTIYPSGKIGLRELGRRTEYVLPLADAWREAANIYTAKLKARVRELRAQGMTLAQARRKARRGV